MGSEDELKKLREQIDGIDDRIRALIVERARCAHRVADVKRAADGEATVFYRPEREAQVLRRMRDAENAPLDGEAVARVFREIMSACLALEQKLRVAYLGPEGTFTQQAAIKHFGHGATTVPLASIDDVFREVEAAAVNYGVVPVENSTEGMITHTLDSFMRFGLRVCGEVELRIHHHLLLSESNKRENITRVYSHQQSLAQCRQWLDTHLPTVERVAVSSNAEAARRIRGEWHAAAIAGEMAAELYGLSRVAENIEDNPNNTTRFLIIGREPVVRSGDDKTSLLVSTRDKPGALYKLLEPFYQAGISLTRIETRPSKNTKWSYVFFIDFEGHESDPQVQQALTAVTAEALDVRVLGSYPKAVL
ncbi:MAG: prephenate dehydratase [Pseudomonadota bacterium]